MPKIGLREATLQRRDRLSAEERREKGLRIEERFFALPAFATAAVVHFYISTRTEVPTEGMVRKCLAMGKRVVSPRVDRRHHRIVLVELKDYDRDLAPGFNGILEPRPSNGPAVPIEEVDLMAIPMVAFDRVGHRLGYGKGFYDRLLGEDERPIRVGLAFEIQEIPSIPSEPHDVRMDWIITEDRMLSF